MVKTYREMLNRQGLQALVEPVHIPDYHLMVGTAEDLSNQPIMVFKDYMPKTQAVNIARLENMSYEDIQQNLASGTLTINDFYQNVYPFGEPVVSD